MFIGVDIGGTHTRVAIGEKGKFSDKKDFPTKEFDDTLLEIKDAVFSFSKHKPKGVGVSIAGPFNFKTNTLHKPPNLPKSWDGKNVAEVFTREIGIPTHVSHDASVIALGEYIYGAGIGKNPVLYFTVSTGIGSGLIVDGKIFHGVFNPEAGHQIINRGGEPHPGAPFGDLEALSSGSALKRLYGQDPVDVEKTPDWNRAMSWLAIGIANSIMHFSPEIVVIGGGMTKHKEIFFKPLKEEVNKFLKEVPTVPIVPASLGQDNGIIGAITLAEQTTAY